MQGMIDDFTGQPMVEGRYFEVGLEQGGNGDLQDAMHTADYRAVLGMIQNALTGKSPRPTISIRVRTWTLPDRKPVPDWMRADA